MSDYTTPEAERLFRTGATPITGDALWLRERAGIDITALATTAALTSGLSGKETAGAAAAAQDAAASDATAKANAAAANAIQRGNHTGTQGLNTISQSSATNGQVPQWSGTAWVPATPSGGGGGTTNLTWGASPTGGTITSSSGTSATLTLANGTNAGLMEPAQFTKLAGINLSNYATTAALTSGLAGKETAGAGAAAQAAAIAAAATDATAKASAAQAAATSAAATDATAKANAAQPLSSISQSGATTGQVPKWSGTAWVPGNVGTITSIITGLGASAIQVNNIVALSQADYTAIVTKDANTLYHIIP